MPTPLNGDPSSALTPGTLPAYTGTESTTAWPGLGQFWRSGYLKNDFPDAAIDTFISWFAKAPLPPAGSGRRAIGYRQADLSFGLIESLGGAIAEVGKTDTAFYWRDQKFSFTFIRDLSTPRTRSGPRTPRSGPTTSAPRWSRTSRAAST